MTSARAAPGMQRTVRREIKYEVSPREAATIEDRLLEHLPRRDRFVPSIGTIVKTVYLDHPDGSITQRCLERPDDSTKVRYRRYEDPSNRFPTSDVSVWIEIKSRVGDLVTKDRILYPGFGLDALFDRRAPVPDCPRLAALLEHDRLVPIASLSFLRAAFEEPDESLRVTIDRQLAVWPPHARPADGVPLDVSILELKPAGDVPDWLSALLDRQPDPVSKFELAVRALRKGAP